MTEKNIPLDYGLIIDMDKPVSGRTVLRTRLGDTASQTVNITLTSGGEKIILPTESNISLYAVRGDGSAIWSSCSLLDDGTVSHTFTSTETQVAGDMVCELYIVTPTSELTTPKFTVTVEGIIRDTDAIEAENDFSLLGELVACAENKAECVHADNSGNLTYAGGKIYLLDDSNAKRNELEKTCEFILEDEKEHLVFVKHQSRFYPASCLIAAGGKLRIEYHYYENGNELHLGTIVYDPHANSAVTVTSKNGYATSTYWEDEDYYYTTPPTIEAIEEHMQGKIDSEHKLSYSLISDKPTIPPAVTEATVSGWGFTKNTGTYSKPASGIPASDLASSVQTSLVKADTAYQKPSSGIPASDIASGVIPEVPETEEAEEISIDTVVTQSSGNLVTSGAVYAALGGKESKGKITIGQTEYGVQISTTDTGETGFITFVVEG